MPGCSNDSARLPEPSGPIGDHRQFDAPAEFDSDPVYQSAKERFVIGMRRHQQNGRRVSEPGNRRLLRVCRQNARPENQEKHTQAQIVYSPHFDPITRLY